MFVPTQLRGAKAGAMKRNLPAAPIANGNYVSGVSMLKAARKTISTDKPKVGGTSAGEDREEEKEEEAEEKFCYV